MKITIDLPELDTEDGHISASGGTDNVTINGNVEIIIPGFMLVRVGAVGPNEAIVRAVRDILPRKPGKYYQDRN